MNRVPGSGTRGSGPPLLLLLSLLLLVRVALTSDGTFVRASVGETLMLTHAFDDLAHTNASYANVTVGCTAVFAGTRLLRRLDVCLLHRTCEPNLVLREIDTTAGPATVAHAGAPIAFLTATLTDATDTSNAESVVTGAVLAPNVTTGARNRTVVLRVPLTTPGNWIYFLDARNTTGGAAHKTVAVVVSPTRRPASVPTKPSAPPPRLPTTTHAPITPLRVEAHFSTGAPHTRLFSPGDTFFVNVSLRSQIYDPGAFSAALEWYRVYPGDNCAVFTVHEPCLYHPNAPACLHPANPGCVFTSPYLAETLFSRLYVQCRTRDPRWTAECSGTVYAHPAPYLAQAANHVDLLFRNTPAAASAVYLFVLRYRGHIETWTYVDVTTAARLTNIEVTHRLPVHASDSEATPAPLPTPDHPVGTGEGSAGGWSGSVVVGLSLASILFCFGAVGLCALCARLCWKRRRAWCCPRRTVLFPWVGSKGKKKTKKLCLQKQPSRPSSQVVYAQVRTSECGGNDAEDAYRDSSFDDDSGNESDVVYERPALRSRSAFTFGAAGPKGHRGGSFADYTLLDI